MQPEYLDLGQNTCLASDESIKALNKWIRRSNCLQIIGLDSCKLSAEHLAKVLATIANSDNRDSLTKIYLKNNKCETKEAAS